jgi:hypothetical protein
MKRVNASAIGALLIVAAGGGLGCTDCKTESSVNTVCDVAGRGHVSSPDGLELPEDLPVGGGCPSGSCLDGGDVAFYQPDSTLTSILSGRISFNGLTGTPPITLDLKALNGTASFNLRHPNGMTDNLDVESGTLVLTSLSRTGFTVTVAATLQAPSGERIVLSDTTARITNCHEAEMCAL